jgi:hypothetical protein
MRRVSAKFVIRRTAYHVLSSADVARRLTLIAKRDKWQFFVKTWRYVHSVAAARCLKSSISFWTEYVRGQVTLHESVSGFYLGGNAKLHFADGSVANGTKPGFMWLSQFQHSTTPFVQRRKGNVRSAFTNDWTSITICIPVVTVESHKLAVCRTRWRVSLKS